MAFEVGEIIKIPSPIDPHVHLREPGGEHKETIATGTFAAARGGYQAVFDMPNNPNFPTVTWKRWEEKRTIARVTSRIDIGFYAGVELDKPNVEELEDLHSPTAGLKIYLGHTTGNPKEYGLEEARPSIDFWAGVGLIRRMAKPILLHAREEVGYETADYVARVGNPVHWCHVSTATEAEYCKKLTKKHPDLFTAGVTPHHLTMLSIDADFKYGWPAGRMMPPLAKEVDHEKLLDYFNKGHIQILETDHAPHAKEEKLKAESENPEGHDGVDCVTCFGVSGIEFVFPVMMSLVVRKIITSERLVDATHHQVVRMLGLKASEMAKKQTVVELGPYTISETDIVGKSQNTPYVGWTGWGRIIGFEKNGKFSAIEDKPKKDVKILIGER